MTLYNGTKSLSDISVFWKKVSDTAYATCCKFKELEFTENPYAEGGMMVSWDPTTGNPRGNRKTFQPKAVSTTQAEPAASRSQATNKAKTKAPKGSGYCGSNYNPTYQSGYGER